MYKECAARFSIGLLVVVFLSLGALADAQVLTGTLTGSVVDATDARIPGASVTVIDIGTGRQYATISDDQGNFTVTNLPNGFYRVTVELTGFSRFTADQIQVNVAQTSRIIARLEVAGTTTEVTVVHQQAVVQTESMELKNAVDRRQIMELPLPTRNPLDLVRTMAGIVTPPTSGIADAFVHGLRGNSTNITQDGINVADNFVKTSSFFAISAPTVDAVGEFNVSVGGVGVDAGFGAAQVNIRTQRGSNEFHGSAYWFQRTRALNANTWFNNATRTPRPFQLQNRIGFNVGGPVYIPKAYDGRNSTWFFWNYEAFREPLARSRTRTVLTSSARTGQFTYRRADNGQLNTVNLLGLGTIGNTGRTPTVNGAVMDFYNSIVPTDGLTDTGCSGDSFNVRCFTFNLPGKGVQDRYTLRLDHQLFANHSLEFVFNQADFDSTPDLLNGIEPL
ncbi:MAG: carboxypeptidase regulatory-like domain-containing protein, partial [Acidobacteria bacterium]|nr:carboxypeptidase regulatory-like domain-containing protein [Acidobacteriota bacterium]